VSTSEHRDDRPARRSRDQLEHRAERLPLDVLRLERVPSELGAREQSAHFWDYWRVLRRRRWIVLTVFVISVAIAVVLTATTPPLYRATATLKIERDPPRILKFEEVIQETALQPDDYQTQYKIMRTRSLASRVIKEQSLEEVAELRGTDGHGSSVARALTGLGQRMFALLSPPPSTVADDLRAHSKVVDTYLDRLSVDPVRNSRLVALSFVSRDPHLAAGVANAAAETFIAHQLDQKVQATRYATNFLAQQLENARDRLEQAEKKLNGFMTANDIIFLNTEKTGQPPDLVTQQLAVLSDALLKARAERIAKDSLVTGLKESDVNSVPAVLRSQLISQLKQEAATLDSEYKRLGQIFKPEYPRMQQLAEKTRETRRQLEVEVDRAVGAVRAEYQAAVQNERDLEAALVQQQSRARGLSARMAEYNLLRRNVDAGRELHGSLLSRMRETQISASLLTSNTSVADRAEVPTAPWRPRKLFNVLLGLVIGLFGGVGLAFVINYLDTTIKTAREAERLLRVRLLGEIPSQAVGRRALPWRDSSRLVSLASHSDATSALAEVFRSLRTTILYTDPDDPPRVLMVTSIHPGEGKTSLATNLAVSLAELDSGAVLLIDADFRRPAVHEVLGVARTPGFADVLAGRKELDLVVVPTSVPNLWTIPSGSPHEAAELCASPRLRQVLSTLEERFRYIVLDTPPLLGLSDAMILASQADGVILTIREGRASRDAARLAIKTLAAVRARLLGAVLNDVRGDTDYYYYSGYTGRRAPPRIFAASPPRASRRPE
jgi:polysaccharide biosynthesis transport protein